MKKIEYKKKVLNTKIYLKKGVRLIKRLKKERIILVWIFFIKEKPKQKSKVLAKTYYNGTK